MHSRHPHATAASVFAVTTAYAVIRYNVFKGVPWAHLPLFVLNKSVAWTSVSLILIGLVQWLRSSEAQGSARNLSIGYALGGLHVIASLALLSPVRYPDLYDQAQQLSGLGGLALLSGLIGTAAALWARGNRFGPVLVSAAIATHCAFLGARGWTTPHKWPGFLLPITLISAVTALGAMSVAVVALRRRG